jgi:hypothetical protein
VACDGDCGVLDWAIAVPEKTERTTTKAMVTEKSLRKYMGISSSFYE